MILAQDEASVRLQATLMRVWSPIGQTPVVKISPQRKSTHFYGALNLQSGQQTVMRAEKMNSRATIHFLAILWFTYYKKSILLIWDRASWHRSKAVDTFLMRYCPNIEILWLPPASPDLNPQEHVWKNARETITHNHSFAKFGQLADAFEQHLSSTIFNSSLLDQHNFNNLCNMFK